MKKFFYILILFLIIAPINFASAESMAGKLSGRILLQVEGKGEAWYVNPKNLKKYFLGRPDGAFFVMRNLGIGIANSDLAKIPVATENLAGRDSDGDGLPDSFEDAIGTDPKNTDTDGDGRADKNELNSDDNPSGSGRLPIDLDFARKKSGKIFLQVENHGEAWYVNPKNLKRYFLGRPDDAFSVMRLLGLGITNANLEKINIAEDSLLPILEIEEELIKCSEDLRISSDSRYNLTEMEKEIHELINQERQKMGLKRLEWNCEIAKVARAHSLSLVRENAELTGLDRTCDYPLIHHENLDSGLYHAERLNNSGIYYFNMAGENIALMPGAVVRTFNNLDETASGLLENCDDERDNFNDNFNEKIAFVSEKNKAGVIEEEIEKRKREFAKEITVSVEEIEWDSQKKLSEDTVNGWMDSPGHKANILTPEYDETGIGVAYINGYIVATQVFITRVDCAYKNGPCCIKEGYYPSCFSGLKCERDVCK